MRYRPHFIFRKTQHTVEFELPNDVFYEFMTILQRLRNPSAAKSLRSWCRQSPQTAVACLGSAYRVRAARVILTRCDCMVGEGRGALGGKAKSRNFPRLGSQCITAVKTVAP